MNWITLEEAMTLTGHKKPESLARWITRWNQANPAYLIARRYGRVDKATLLWAITREQIVSTPGMAERAAAVRVLTQKRRARCNEPAVISHNIRGK